MSSSDSSFNQKMSTLNWKARLLLAHPLRVALSNVKKYRCDPVCFLCVCKVLERDKRLTRTKQSTASPT